MSRFFLRLLLLLSFSYAFDEEFKVLDADDQCAGKRESDCAFVALQARTLKLQVTSDDITAETERFLFTKVSDLQKEVKGISNEVSNVEAQVNETRSAVEAAGKFTVTWDQGTIPPTTAAPEVGDSSTDGSSLAQMDSSTGRRRRSEAAGPPHREEKVVKALHNLEAKLQVVFKTINEVDRVNAGIGNALLKHRAPVVKIATEDAPSATTEESTSDVPSTTAAQIDRTAKRKATAVSQPSSEGDDDETTNQASDDDGPPDHQGKADELWHHFSDVSDEVERATQALDDLKVHVKGINETVYYWLRKG